MKRERNCIVYKLILKKNINAIAQKLLQQKLEIIQVVLSCPFLTKVNIKMNRQGYLYLFNSNKNHS